MLTSKGYRKKCKRFVAPGYPHAVTFTCYKSLPLFNHDAACKMMVDSISSSRDSLHFDLWAWVIMPRHVHLLLLPPPEIETVSPILKAIKQSMSRKYINQHRCSPHILDEIKTGKSNPKYRFWQPGGGHDRIIYGDIELSNWVDYIHNNPVKAGYVDDPTKWTWSSARAWLLDDESMITIDRESIPNLAI